MGQRSEMLQTARPAAPVSRTRAQAAFGITAGLMVLLVLVQAILAGRGWFVNHTFIDIHAGVADFVLLVAIVQVALAIVVARRRQISWSLVALSGLILVLVVAQIGLGYAGKNSGTAASIHVPNGVLIMGLTVATAVMAWGRRRV